MTFPYFHVDAFAAKPFTGNRAGVCLPEKELDTETMQRIADETNLAVTAFIRQQGLAFHLQWFTPEVELPLCGHGTLASAHVLWEQGFIAPGEEVVFTTHGGRLTIRQLSDGWMELDFPAFGTSPVQLPPACAGLFPDPIAVWQSNGRYLVELDGEEEVRGFIPDVEKLKKHHLIITSRSAPGSSFDFVSRFFAGPVGVPEDPVTGSAHCSLGPYWSEKLGKKEMLAYQASRRGGVMKLRLERDRVLIAGQAVTLVKGRLHL